MVPFERGAGPRRGDVHVWGGASAQDLRRRGEAAGGREGLWRAEFGVWR